MNMIHSPKNIQMYDEEKRTLRINEVFEKHGLIITLKKGSEKCAILCVEYDGNNGELIDPPHGCYVIENDSSVPRVVIRISGTGSAFSDLTVGKELVM